MIKILTSCSPSLCLKTRPQDRHAKVSPSRNKVTVAAKSAVTQEVEATTNVDPAVDHAEGNEKNDDGNRTENGLSTAGTSHRPTGGNTKDTKTEDTKQVINPNANPNPELHAVRSVDLQP